MGRASHIRIDKPDPNTLNIESGGTLTNRGTMAQDATLTAGSGSVNDFPVAAIVLGVVRTIRRRCTIAEVNAGVELLPAVAGYKYRLVDGAMIAVGGAAAAHTTIDILGTQTTPVKLVAFAVAQTAQNTLLKPGVTGAAILAAGASYVANDANTAITVGKTGSDITTATYIDVMVSYVQEAA